MKMTGLLLLRGLCERARWVRWQGEAAWSLLGELNKLLEGDRELREAALRYMTLTNPDARTPLGLLDELGRMKDRSKEDGRAEADPS